MKTYLESSSESPFLKNYKWVSSLFCWTVVALILAVNAYSQDIQPDIEDLYEKHKNTAGFYRACGSPSNFEIQQSDFTYYLNHLNNLRSLNLIWRDFKEETEFDYYDQFLTEDSLRITRLNLAKRFKQLAKTSFQDDISMDDYANLDAINGTQTYRLIKNLVDSVIVPFYELPVYYCSTKYAPSSDFSSTTDILIDKLNFVASVAPSKFKSSYLSQIKALQAPKIAEVPVSLTKEEEAKLAKLRSLISIYENEWGIAIFDYEKLHLLAKEYGHDIPLKVCKYYIDSLIQLFKVDGARMLSELNSKVTKIINGKMPIVRWVHRGQ